MPRRTPTHTPTELGIPAELDYDEIGTLLANRIVVHANACDLIRAEAKDAYTPDEFASISTRLRDSLASLAELERVFTSIYGETPDAVTVSRLATERRI